MEIAEWNVNKFLISKIVTFHRTFLQSVIKRHMTAKLCLSAGERICQVCSLPAMKLKDACSLEEKL